MNNFTKGIGWLLIAMFSAEVAWWLWSGEVNDSSFLYLCIDSDACPVTRAAHPAFYWLIVGLFSLAIIICTALLLHDPAKKYKRASSTHNKRL